MNKHTKQGEAGNMENITLNAKLIKRANNDYDMSLILVGNTVITLDNKMLESALVKSTEDDRWITDEKTYKGKQLWYVWHE